MRMPPKMTGQDRELWAFHFQCPLCGSTPTEVLLREYLQEWAISEPERLSDLLDMLAGAIAQVRTGESRWLTKKFDGASRRIMNALTDLGAAFAFPLAPSERGLCRWCLDMGGGISPAIRLIFDGVGYASVKVEEPDATAPARNCWDILPPEVQKRIESMGCQAQRGGLRH
jgi:hypothetical protein